MQKSTIPPSLNKLRDTAVDAAHAAGQILMKRFRKKLIVNEKPGAGIVTDADLAAERAALRVLKKAFPSFGILTEESGTEKSPGLGRWIIDPLDGTTNFAHGFPMFCVSIAAEWNGKVVAGAIFHPPLSETYTAIRGKGAFVNGRRMKVSSTKDLSSSLFSTGFCSRKEEWLSQEVTSFERMSRATQGIRRPGSAALDLAYVARGTFEGYWERGLSAWDIAAGALLVEEAGGKVTHFNGSSLILDSGELLSSNGFLHQAFIREARLTEKATHSYKTEKKIQGRTSRSELTLS